MTHLNKYLEKIRARGNKDLAIQVEKTVRNANTTYLKNFSYQEHIVSLLLGHVQSGKTSHMFGIIAAAADEGFNIFVILTTDSILLQRQTMERASNDLSSFCICGEDNYIKFQSNNLKLPVIIVLKKNSRILKQWKNNFSSTNFCAGNPIFIVDDEADAASLNTLVNQKKNSTINSELANIKQTSSSSIYLQVTGTPQAILLQNQISGWKPNNVYFFAPGKSYLGGDFFFSSDDMPCIILTDDDESQNILQDDEFPENMLKVALLVHLITSAHIFVNNIDSVSNFIIHPSVKISEHSKFAEKIGGYLNELNIHIDTTITQDAIRQAYQILEKTKNDILPLDQCFNFIKKSLQNNEIRILVLNSESDFITNNNFYFGINIIVGGNSLGRGVTFPKLQTIYYCRTSKSPQADTMWQHSRIFGYDRIHELVRVFMPPIINKIFTDINATNSSIISQIQKHGNIDDVKIYYPPKIKPTRKNVIDNKTLITFTGGVNYFPLLPTNASIEELDSLLAPFSNSGHYQVSLQLITKILANIGDECNNWLGNSFIGFINSYISQNPNEQGILIVRRDRDITKGSGSLLSPDDRALGGKFKDNVVLTLYKVTGAKGWNELKTWIPNIKLPKNLVYYDIS